MILAFDTSCDDTAVACLKDCRRYSNVVLSQNKIHSRYGGVIPELAARAHLEAIGHLTGKAMEEVSAEPADIDLVAVTTGPGLAPSLLVGVAFAKAFAYANNARILSINHIEGHLFAPFFCRQPVYPFIGLVVSGGHTHLFLVEGLGKYRLLGKTLDDAVGEAFDKVARLLEVGYPGGPVIDRLSKSGNPFRFRIPAGLEHQDTYNFSFSGTKTAVKNLVKKLGSLSITDKQDIAAAFQKTAIDILTKRSFDAAKDYRVANIVVSGGVSANSYLRESFAQRAKEEGINLFLPDRQMTTDNALMIAYVAQLRSTEAHSDYFLIEANPRSRIY